MKKGVLNIYAFLLLTTFHATQAQITTSVVNQRTFGGSLNEMPSCGLKTADNGYIIGGGSESSISGDKTEPNRGLYNDYWIIRLNPDLSIKWQKTIGGNSNDFLQHLIGCKDGGFICVGSSVSPISGEKAIAGYGDNDYWVIKIDSSGNILWQNVYGGTGADQPSSIIRLTNGKYIIGGTSDSDSSGVKTENSRGVNDY